MMVMMLTTRLLTPMMMVMPARDLIQLRRL